MTGTRAIRRALISVYDKTGLTELARGLAAAGVEIVSTGSTAARIAEAGVEVTEVEALTGFPETLEGRVKTLHPKVHAGILADSRKPEHLSQLDDLGIEPFDLVVVNLYPFAETVASGAGFDECIEQIDIGGPSMVRAAAKNHPTVTVITDPADYPAVTEAAAGGASTSPPAGPSPPAPSPTPRPTTPTSPRGSPGSSLPRASVPDFAGLTGNKLADLRYGENPHQSAAVYSDGTRGIAGARLLGGKPMSYNNYTDTDAAIRAAYDFDQPAVAIIKHANPCGIAVAETPRRRPPGAPRLGSALGLRRCHRRQPRGRRRTRGVDQADLHRMPRGPVVLARGARDPGIEEEPAPHRTRGHRRPGRGDHPDHRRFPRPGP